MDWMDQYSSRKTAKVVKESDLKAKKAQTEESHQLALCKWIKANYPDVLFRSDIQSSSNKSPYLQNLKQILDPYSGWPDVMVYGMNLGIEMKRIGASINNDHFRNQAAMHERLRLLGWSIHVCFGAEEAKKVFLEYYNK